jgi:hypothetical protein
VVQAADAHLAGFNRLPSFLPHGGQDLPRGQKCVAVRRSRHWCLGEYGRRGAPDFAVGDFDCVACASVTEHNLNLSFCGFLSLAGAFNRTHHTTRQHVFSEA